MSITFNANVYGITDFGEKIKIGETKTVLNDGYPVGGKIFYIDDTATDRTYHFYNNRGVEIPEVHVGDEVFAYSVTGTGAKDKFYVYYPSVFTLTRWTYKNGDSYTYTQFVAPMGNRAIGQGKTISAQVMSADSGAYIAENVDGNPTAWYRIKQINDAKANGCDDWYMPSQNELEALYNAQNASSEYIARTLFDNNIWTVSEDNSQVVRYLPSSNHTFTTIMKSANCAVLPIRSF